MSSDTTHLVDIRNLNQLRVNQILFTATVSFLRNILSLPPLSEGRLKLFPFDKFSLQFLDCPYVGFIFKERKELK